MNGAGAENTSRKHELHFEELPWRSTGKIISVHNINELVGWSLLALVLFVPMAAGGNRPVVWMLVAAFIGGLLLLHGGVMLLSGRRVARRAPALLWGGAALALYAGLQSQPLPTWFPERPASGYLSTDPDASFIAAIRIASYLGFFFLVQQVAGSAQRVMRLLWWLGAGVFAHAIWALAALSLLGDIALWGAKEAYQGMATGAFVNRNSLATFLAMGIAVVMVLAMRRLGETAQQGRPAIAELMLPGLALLTMMAAVLATGSRMGLAAATLAALMAGAIMSWKLALSRARTMLLLMLAGLLALPVFGAVAVDRLIFSIAELGPRLSLYQQVAAMIAANPLWGVGADAFASAFEIAHGPGLSGDLIWHLPHNSYLTNWVEMGLFFGSLPLLIGLYLGIWLIRCIRRRTQFFAPPVAALAALAAASLHSILDFSLEFQGNTLLLIFLLGLSTARLRKAGSA